MQEKGLCAVVATVARENSNICAGGSNGEKVSMESLHENFMQKT
jgi:hypothetical protein